jgi:glucokinase
VSDTKGGLGAPAFSSIEDHTNSKGGARAIGVDIGGTKIAAIVAQGNRILAYTKAPTPQTGLADLEECVEDLVLPWLKQHGSMPIGVCTPGLLDPVTGTILYASNIKALTNVDLASHLTQRLGVSVYVENDANAAAYAEYHYGAGHGWRSVFYLTISTGIGGGFINQYGIFRGSRGYAADIGHMTVNPDGPICSCGERGCLEAYASGVFIAKHASALYQQPLTTRDVFIRAQAGEQRALSIIDQAAQYLALGLANTSKVLDPEGIVIGGGVASAGPFFRGKIQHYLSIYLRNFRTVEVRCASLGTLAGAIGVASLALAKFRNQPSTHHSHSFGEQQQ